MFNYHAFTKFLEEACEHYEKSAPTVAEYCNDLYLRINGDNDNVRLSEIGAVEILKENGIWEDPNYAANRIYKLMYRLGLNTTGHAGF